MTSLTAWEREEREESALPMAVCVRAYEIESMLDVKSYGMRGGRGGRRGGGRGGGRRRCIYIPEESLL